MKEHLPWTLTVKSILTEQGIVVSRSWFFLIHVCLHVEYFTDTSSCFSTYRPKAASLHLLASFYIFTARSSCIAMSRETWPTVKQGTCSRTLTQSQQTSDHRQRYNYNCLTVRFCLVWASSPLQFSHSQQLHRRHRPSLSNNNNGIIRIRIRPVRVDVLPRRPDLPGRVRD